MCLILFAVNQHRDFPFVVAANRDEFLARPTAPAARWPEDENIWGGRDLVAGGTWLGVSAVGRLAAVTNVREPGRNRADARSRGELVTGMLRASDGAAAYLADLDGALYNGYNAIAYTGGRVLYATNRGDGKVQAVDQGVHGLSNARLNTPWPKVVEGRGALDEALGRLDPERPDPTELLALLASDIKAPDTLLPNTGVGLDLERELSSAFIRTDGYGTRSSTAVLYHRDGWCLFSERTYPPSGGAVEDRSFIITFIS